MGKRKEKKELKKQKDLPAITGKQLIKLLKKAGWQSGRQATHGITMVKYIKGRKRVTFIPDTGASIPKGTLGAIIGHKQTILGREGLIKLIEKYGLK